MANGPEEEIVIMYVPCGTEDEAASLARVLLDERLIACANIYASRSMYRWQDRVADESEHVMLAKTVISRVGSAVERVEKLHSYEVPCILTFRPDKVNEAYAGWVVGEFWPTVSPPVAAVGPEA